MKNTFSLKAVFIEAFNALDPQFFYKWLPILAALTLISTLLQMSGELLSITRYAEYAQGGQMIGIIVGALLSLYYMLVEVKLSVYRMMRIHASKSDVLNPDGFSGLIKGVSLFFGLLACVFAIVFGIVFAFGVTDHPTLTALIALIVGCIAVASATIIAARFSFFFYFIIDPSLDEEYGFIESLKKSYLLTKGATVKAIVLWLGVALVEAVSVLALTFAFMPFFHALVNSSIVGVIGWLFLLAIVLIVVVYLGLLSQLTYASAYVILKKKHSIDV